MDSSKQLSFRIFKPSKIIIICLILFLATPSLNSCSQNKKYPKVSKEKHKDFAASISELIKQSKSNPKQAIQGLENLEELPRLLENRKNYILGKLYNQAGNQAMAFVRFSEVDKDYLPKHNLWKLIKLSTKLGMEQVVIDNLKLLNKQYPTEAKFQYDLAKAHLRQSQKEEAKELLNKVQKDFPQSDYAIGANYYLGNLSETREEKISYFRQYLQKSSRGSLSTLISQQISNMDKESQAKFDDLKSNMALGYFEIGDYKKAKKLFDKNTSFWYEYAQTLAKLKQKGSAIKVISVNLDSENDIEKSKKAIEYLTKISPSKYQTISHLKELLPKMQINKDMLLWHIAKRTRNKADYQKVYENYPDSFYAAESMSRVFWKEYQAHNYDQALKLADQHWESYDYARSHPYVAFWKGKIYNKKGNKEKANEVFKSIIGKHPYDYYSFRANAILNSEENWFLLSRKLDNEYIHKLAQSNDKEKHSLKDQIVKEDLFANKPKKHYQLSQKEASEQEEKTAPEQTTSRANTQLWDWPSPYSDKEIEKQYGEDIAELIKIQQYSEVMSLDENKDIELDKKMKMWLYAMSGNHLKAISTAYFSLPKGAELDLDEIKFQYSFPLLYTELVLSETQKRSKVDPLLVHALMKQESRYQPEIVSRAGAIGLMQLMPYTAKLVAKQLKHKSPKVEDLMQPELNVELGVKYMEEVFERFDNNMIFAIASYNAGPVAVKRWQNKAPNKDPDQFIEDIPYNETRGYVKKVLMNYWIYQQLYKS